MCWSMGVDSDRRTIAVDGPLEPKKYLLRTISSQRYSSPAVFSFSLIERTLIDSILLQSVVATPFAPAGCETCGDNVCPINSAEGRCFGSQLSLSFCVCKK